MIARGILQVLALLAAGVLVAVSATINYLFLSRQASDRIDGELLGAVSIAFDILKCLLPIFIAWAWRERRFGYVVLATPAFAVFAAFSLMSGLGFAGEARSGVVGGRDALASRLALVEQEHKGVRARLAQLGAVAPAGRIEGELAASRQDPRWSSSRSCTEATASASRSFCDAYLRRQGELAAAVEAERIRGDLIRLSREISDLKAQGAGREADPQAGLLTRLVPGLRLVHAQLGWTLAIAVLIEMGSSFGPFLATGHSRRSRKQAQGAQTASGQAEPSAPVLPAPDASATVAAGARADQSRLRRPPRITPPAERATIGTDEERFVLGVHDIVLGKAKG